MAAHGLPTAAYAVFTDYDAALAYLEAHPRPSSSRPAAWRRARGPRLRHRRRGPAGPGRDHARAGLWRAGDEVVIEEFLRGQEVSVLAFCDGRTAVPMVLAQDHKAAYDGDHGPNTGGMGCYAPAPLLSDATLARVREQVLQPVVDGMAAQGSPYVGVLYAGLMIEGEHFDVLEFNCRFGDPEAEVILPLLQTDLVTVLLACLEGRLDEIELTWAPLSCVTVVLAAGGYPGSYRKGDAIEGLEAAGAMPDTVVFHAGTRRDGDRVLTAGGRVLDVTAWGHDLPTAVDRAYDAAAIISWPDCTLRHDIGAKGMAGLIRRRATEGGEA